MATKSNVRSRHRYIKSLSLGLNDALFSTSRWPWATFDLLLVAFFFSQGVRLSPYGSWQSLSSAYQISAWVHAACFVLIAFGMGFYDRLHRFDFLSILRSGFVANVLGSILSLSILYFYYYSVFGRWVLVYGVLGTYVGVTVVRLVLAAVLRKNPYRFTIIGNSPYLSEVVEFCQHKKRFSQFYVHIPWKEVAPDGKLPEIGELLSRKVGDIVFTQEEFAKPEVLDFAIHALQAKLRVVDEATFYAQVFERIPVDTVSRDWAIQQGIAGRHVMTTFAKRILDISVSGLMLIILSPMLLAIAAIIKVTSPGPVFFNQRRQGRYSNPFKMYKFRTMTAAQSKEDASGGFTKAGDARVTAIGKILRPLHFDEFPQLVNILKGDMSLVGPRPEALEFARRMKAAVPLYDLRYLVRPGLTGHAQVNMGYAMDNVEDTKKKLSFDLYYLLRHTIGLDLQIILRTAFVLTRKAR